MWQSRRGPLGRQFRLAADAGIEQDNALELVGAVETKLRRIKAMMTLLGVQASRREISNGGFYAHDYSGRPQSLRTGTDTATEAGLELSPTTISLIAAVIEGAFTGAPRRSEHGLWSSPSWPLPHHHSRNCRPCPTIVTAAVGRHMTTRRMKPKPKPPHLPHWSPRNRTSAMSQPLICRRERRARRMSRRQVRPIPRMTRFLQT